MCGRYTFRTPVDQVAEFFGVLDDFPRIDPLFNIAPTQLAPIIAYNASGDLVMRLYKWGLVPHWADDPAIGNKLINARAETIASKPAYRAGYKRRRCVVPADGFYEWAKVDRKRKQPYYIHRTDNQPFAFAGLWEEWADADNLNLRTFTIITTEPNDLVREIHNRMPVIFNRDQIGDWLGDDLDKASNLLRACDASGWIADPVSTRVNSPANDTPDLITPIYDE